MPTSTVLTGSDSQGCQVGESRFDGKVGLKGCARHKQVELGDLRPFQDCSKISGRDSVTTSALQDRSTVAWYMQLSTELKKCTAHLATDISHCLVAKTIQSPLH